jgi:hypothetical protein
MTTQYDLARAAAAIDQELSRLEEALSDILAELHEQQTELKRLRHGVGSLRADRRPT